MSRRLPKAEEVFESSGGPSEAGDEQGSDEDLFQKMHVALHSLMKNYEIKEEDIQSSLDVIGQLWEVIDVCRSSSSQMQEQMKELEEKWQDEKKSKRLTEKRKAELEIRFDEDRYRWQQERQSLEKEKALLETRNSHLVERNKELYEDLEEQKQKYDDDQKTRNELLEQYKKQYEVARTSTLRRSVRKGKSKSSYLDDQRTNPTDLSKGTSAHRPFSQVTDTHNPSLEANSQQSIPTWALPSHSVCNGSQEMASLERPEHNSRNLVSLRGEIKHSTATWDDIPKSEQQEHVQTQGNQSYEDDPGISEEMVLQQELYDVSPDLLAPTVTEVEMLKKEREDLVKQREEIRKKMERERCRKEEMENNNAELVVEVDHLKKFIDELLTDIQNLRQERDDILESYLDQPFDVYCITKKELHEVLKKLHASQMENQRHKEDMMTLEEELERRRRKKSAFMKFKEKMKKMFYKPQEIVQEEVPKPTELLSVPIPPEQEFVAKTFEEILSMEKFTVANDWLLMAGGYVRHDSLPSQYCQIALREYHVTEQLNCMALGQVYLHSEPYSTSSKKRRATLLPLAARTRGGYLCAEVWIACVEGRACFVEVMDVLAKKIVDRFLMKGSSVVCMKKISGLLPDLKESLTGMHFLSNGERTPDNSPRVLRRNKQAAGPQSVHKPPALALAPSGQAEGSPALSPLGVASSPFKSVESDVETVSKYHDLKHYYRKRISQQSTTHPEESDLYVGILARSSSTEGEGESHGPFSPSAAGPSQESQPSNGMSKEDGGMNSHADPPSAPNINQYESTVVSDPTSQESLATEMENFMLGGGMTPQEGKTSQLENRQLFQSTPKSPTGEEDKDSTVGIAAFNSSKSLFDDNPPSLDMVEVSEEDLGANKQYWNGSSQKTLDKSFSSLSFGNSMSREDPDAYMWIISDDNRIYFYLPSRSTHKPVGLAPLPENSVAYCLDCFDDKVFVGLSDSRLLIFYLDSTMSTAGIWDILNPELITVPTPDPTITHPICCLVLVNNRLWIGTGPFLAFLEMDSHFHEGPDSKTVCEIRNGESTYLRLAVSHAHNAEQVGELNARSRECHRCKITLKGFEAIDVTLSNTGNFFYRLKPTNPKYDGPKYSIVLKIDKLSFNEPTNVIISSPVMLESHTSYKTAIYWAVGEKLQGDPGQPLTVLSPGEPVALPLDKAYTGFLFLQPLKEDQSPTSVSTRGFTWSMSSKGCLVDADPYIIQVGAEEDSYQNKLPFSLKSHPHHILHLYHPLLLSNLLPYNLELTSIGKAIGQGESITLDKVDHNDGKKLSIKTIIEGEEYTGSVHVHLKSTERSTFELKSSESKAELSLCLMVEESGNFHASIYSPYWIINRTGLTLQYKSKTSWTSSDKIIHRNDQRVLLYLQDEVVVRVIDKDDEHSKWSESFSLDAVGSEGVLTCSWESSKAPRQMGTRVRMSKFGLTKIITISPFFMLHNKTSDCVSVIEKGMSRLVASAIVLKPKELCPFWPETDSDLILVSLRDSSSPGFSSPFDYTINGCLLLRLPQSSPQDVCGVVADIRVTGSANIVCFTPYSSGDAPVELVNDFFFPIVYGQRKGGNGNDMVRQHQLGPQQRVLFTWDEPGSRRELVWGWLTESTDKEEQDKYKILPIRDGHGNFTIPEELRGLPPPESPATIQPPTRFVEDEGEKESDLEPATQFKPEAIESDVDHPAMLQGGAPSEKHKGIWSSVGSAAKRVGSGAKKIGTGVATGVKKGGSVTLGAVGGVTTGVKMVGGGVAGGAKKLTSGVKKVSRGLVLRKRRKDADKGYWVSFTDDLQRVILLTPERNTWERARRDTEPKLVELEVIFSLIGVGISLVNDKKGKEIAYIGLPQSEPIWEVNKRKRRWKPVETLLSKSLEKLYELDKQEVIPIEGSDYKVDFRESDRLMLLNTKDRKKKGELRRSHFDGVKVRLGFSRKLMTIELQVNQVQIDNQLPFARNPTVFFCYPPSPSIASTTTPKPFIDGSLIIRRSENADVHVIQFVQILVQEMGFTLDLDFVIELAALFDSLGREVPKKELVAEEITNVQLSLRDAEAMLVSSAGSRSFFKFMHLSPLLIHLSFSLEISSEQKKKLDFYAQHSFALKFVIDILHTFFGLIGRAKDAELKLGSFQIQERVLTNKALIQRVVNHYEQQGLYQMYSLVLGLEVLGNPVGFLRGLTEGTIGLFYQPIQGAVVGPGEFLEGLSIGTHQFIEGTLGGVAGMGARMTGVLGDAVAKLTFDSDFQKQRQLQSDSLGQGLESFAMGVFHGVTGIVAQPVRGAKKEGFLGFLKGTGKGVIGLVLRPAGGLIDFTSTTLSVVQKKTTLGEFELTQIRSLRYIGSNKIIHPYSPTKSVGYAMFLGIHGGKLASTDTFISHLELTEDPVKTLMVTDRRTMIVKYNSFVSRWEEDWVVQFSEVASKVTRDNNIILFPMKEHHGLSIPFGLGGKKSNVKSLAVNTPDLAIVATMMINRAFQQYKMQEEWDV